MIKRPIFWGVLALVIGIAGWFVSVILSALTGGAFREAANIFARIAYIGFPIAVLLEIINRIRK